MPTILYRKSLTEDSEREIMARYFPITDCMVGIKNELVIARYSAVPFYDEVEKGLALQGSKLINSFRQHNYIANFSYYYDIEDYTPHTWFRLQDVPKGGPYVVKGVTTSKKHQWDQMMFAPAREDAIRIAVDLKNDYYIGSQDIIVRQYVPLVRLGTGTHNMPFTNEWRFFMYKNQILSYGFYWSECDIKGNIDEKAFDLVDIVASLVAGHTNFYTLDIGQKDDGEWTVIEMNDGQMAGLSMNDPETVYRKLAAVLKDENVITKEI
jgi:hypothetical protein